MKVPVGRMTERPDCYLLLKRDLFNAFEQLWKPMDFDRDVVEKGHAARLQGGIGSSARLHEGAALLLIGGMEDLGAAPLGKVTAHSGVPSAIAAVQSEQEERSGIFVEVHLGEGVYGSHRGAVHQLRGRERDLVAQCEHGIDRVRNGRERRGHCRHAARSGTEPHGRLNDHAQCSLRPHQ
jgi:hypothetical protein